MKTMATPIERRESTTATPKTKKPAWNRGHAAWTCHGRADGGSIQPNRQKAAGEAGKTGSM